MFIVWKNNKKVSTTLFMSTWFQIKMCRKMNSHDCFHSVPKTLKINSVVKFEQRLIANFHFYQKLYYMKSSFQNEFLAILLGLGLVNKGPKMVYGYQQMFEFDYRIDFCRFADCANKGRLTPCFWVQTKSRQKNNARWAGWAVFCI